MIKAVFDTNIFISAFLKPKGLTAQLLDMASRNQFNLFISSQILNELGKVLYYPHIRKIRPCDDEVINLFIGFVLETCDNIGQTPEIFVVPNDPKDNHIVSTALGCKSDYLVSGDKAHILSLGDVGTLKIVSPRKFKNLIDESV